MKRSSFQKCQLTSAAMSNVLGFRADEMLQQRRREFSGNEKWFVESQPRVGGGCMSVSKSAGGSVFHWILNMAAALVNWHRCVLIWTCLCCLVQTWTGCVMGGDAQRSRGCCEIRPPKNATGASCLTMPVPPTDRTCKASCCHVTLQLCGLIYGKCLSPPFPVIKSIWHMCRSKNDHSPSN